MTDPKHIDAVTATFWPTGPMTFALYSAREISRDILDSTDPEVHAAMLDALTRHGVLSEDTRTRLDGYGGMIDTGTGAGPMVIARAATNERRLVTSWEVTS